MIKSSYSEISQRLKGCAAFLLPDFGKIFIAHNLKKKRYFKLYLLETVNSQISPWLDSIKLLVAKIVKEG